MNQRNILSLIVIVPLLFLFTQCSPRKNKNHNSIGSLDSQEQKITSNQQVNLLELNLDPQQYVDLYNNWIYKNATKLQSPPHITGNNAADTYIQQKAEARGYKLRAEADESRLVSIGHIHMQPEMFDSWNAMKCAAVGDGVHLDLISGYRSVIKQRQIFNRNFGANYTSEEIHNGSADADLDFVLSTRSIPGYSKHHTGYTIDITDQSIGYDFTKFEQTDGFDWISKNNFENARKFGFIPSYPKGAKEFGPFPETWEYVWIGDTVSVNLLMKIDSQ